MSDPINPAHYNGKACAHIGQHLTGNGYQILKYNWRLGKKDDVLQEMGKSIWYLDEEIALAASGWRAPVSLMWPMAFPVGWSRNDVFPPDEFFSDLLIGQDEFVKAIVWLLIGWTKLGDIDNLHTLRAVLISHRAKLETERTGQTTMEV